MTHRSNAIASRLLGALLVASMGACHDAFLVTPARTTATLGIAYSVGSGFSATDEEAFGKADRVHVRVNGTGVAIDTVVVFEPAAEVRIRLVVDGAEDGNSYAVAVELRRGADALFRGTADADLRDGQTSEVHITLTPVGSAVVLPSSVRVLSTIGDTLTVPVSVIFATGDRLSVQPAVTWSSSDTLVAVTAGNGRVTARGPGSAVIRATHAQMNASVSIRVSVPPVREYSIAAGFTHTCAINEDGVAFCWGANGLGQLGDGTNTSSPTPVRVSGNIAFSQISASGNGTCAVAHNGEVYCWGAGTGSVPVVMSGGLKFTSLVLHGYLSAACAIATDRTAYCRGNNSFGQLGTGDTIARTVPTPVAGGIAFTSISAGLAHTCGIAVSGSSYCWGWNANAQIGTGAPPNSPPLVPVPTQVAGGNVFRSLAAGTVTTCGTTATAAYCWGFNYFGTIGGGDTRPAAYPSPVQIAGGVLFQQIIGGRENNIYSINCGLTNTGAAYCWGANTRGQLGTQATLASCTQGNLIFGCTGSPVPVAGSLSFAALAIGNEHVCGLTTNQRVYCWGRNDAGQLGTGTTQDVATPVQAATTIRFP